MPEYDYFGKKIEIDIILINYHIIYFLVNSVTVEIGKYGRIVLPKDIRNRYKLDDNSRLIIRERQGEIVLIPVKRYKNPTEAFYGSVKPDQPIDDPKEYARRHLAKKMREDSQ